MDANKAEKFKNMVYMYNIYFQDEHRIPLNELEERL